MHETFINHIHKLAGGIRDPLCYKDCVD